MPLFYFVIVFGVYRHSELTRTKEVIILFILPSTVTPSKKASLGFCILYRSFSTYSSEGALLSSTSWAPRTFGERYYWPTSGKEKKTEDAL